MSHSVVSQIRAALVVVMMVVVSLLIPVARRIPCHIAHHEFTPVSHNFGVFPAEGRVGHLAARGLVQVLPSLAVVAIETAAGFGAGRVVGGDRVTVWRRAVTIMFGTSVSVERTGGVLVRYCGEGSSIILKLWLKNVQNMYIFGP